MASNLIYVVIIPILAFFFLKDGGAHPRTTSWTWWTTGPRRALLDDVLADVHLLLAHYMRALVLLSLATFVAYASSSRSWACRTACCWRWWPCLEFIPMLGPLTAARRSCLVAPVSGAHVWPV